MNIIDALTQGFNTVHRRWWVLLIPILLDIFLWLGPQVAIEPIVAEMSATLRESALLVQIEQADPTLKEAFLTTLDDLGKRYNLFSALRVRMLGMPSLLVWGGAGYHMPSAYEVFWVYFLSAINIPDLLVSVAPATFFARPVWQLADPFAWLGLNLAVWLLGIVIGSIYLTMVARSIAVSANTAGSATAGSATAGSATAGSATVGSAVAELPTAKLPTFWAQTAQLGGQVLLFSILRVIVLVVLGLPLLAFLGILGMLSSFLANMVAMGIFGVLIWLSFYGIWFVAALAVNRSTLWQALWNSFNIVLRNFWQTLGIFALINLIGGGLTILWQRLSTGSWLTLVGILGNAYVGSSLLTGSLIFYHDRYNRWRERAAQLLAEMRRQS